MQYCIPHRVTEPWQQIVHLGRNNPWQNFDAFVGPTYQKCKQITHLQDDLLSRVVLARQVIHAGGAGVLALALGSKRRGVDPAAAAAAAVAGGALPFASILLS
jgi:hypothetical protein